MAIITLGVARPAAAVQVAHGTFATPLGPVDWKWDVKSRRWDPSEQMITQTLVSNAAFNSVPFTGLGTDRVRLWHGGLLFQTRTVPAPAVIQQFYPYDTQAMNAWPVNLTGLITLSDVRALKVHYRYSDTQPSTAGVTDQTLAAPAATRRLHHTRLKFWMVTANGGLGGHVYDLQTARGKVRICHKRCRYYWKLIYKFPASMPKPPLGQLTPATAQATRRTP